MAHSRIPLPRSQQERIDDFVRRRQQRYVVEEASSGRIIAMNLGKWEVMEFVWTHDGRDYRIERRQGDVMDDIGRSTGVTYQLADLFGLEWDVYFKNGSELPWRKARITAYGVNEREALLNLLEEGLRREAWADYFNVRLQTLYDARVA